MTGYLLIAQLFQCTVDMALNNLEHSDVMDIVRFTQTCNRNSKVLQAASFSPYGSNLQQTHPFWPDISQFKQRFIAGCISVFVLTAVTYLWIQPFVNFSSESADLLSSNNCDTIQYAEDAEDTCLGRFAGWWRCTGTWLMTDSLDLYNNCLIKKLANTLQKNRKESSTIQVIDFVFTKILDLIFGTLFAIGGN